MTEAHVRKQTVFCCPSCRSSEHRVFRRLPAPMDGCITNQCICEKCGMYYTFLEDREGKSIEHRT